MNIALSFGDVRKKRLVTPNHFVSHMIEHIAWRMGLSIDLETDSCDWKELGTALGKAITGLGVRNRAGAALGMIDDGSAHVAVTFGDAGSARITAVGGVDLQVFLAARCEQLESGAPLVELLHGLSAGLGARIEVTVWSFEDTHHTWEGIFRGVGIALSRCCTPDAPTDLQRQLSQDRAVTVHSLEGELQVVESGAHRAVVRRGTAETGITVAVDFGGSQDSGPGCDTHAARCSFQVDSSIEYGVRRADELFSELARALGATLEIDFKATLLSSSHVVMEDIGLVLGRALLEILKIRMERYGTHGAGSTISSPADRSARAINVGVSVEGRKFWKFIPGDGDYARLRREFLIGQNCLGSLRSEDLDDFVDGLAGGMSASISIHVIRIDTPSTEWVEVFRGLGAALRGAFELNPFRRGVPPGVKATLV